MEKTKSDYSFRLFDFVISDPELRDEEESSDSDETRDRPLVKKDLTIFQIQMFGINEKGEVCSITVNDYKPFFYVKVDDEWKNSDKDKFYNHLKKEAGKYYENSIYSCELVKHKKLYGFDKGKLYKFIKVTFESTKAMNKVKQLWYTKKSAEEMKEDDRFNSKTKLNPKGYVFNYTMTKLYEAKIPPLLRFFHIRNVSPSGWITIPEGKAHISSVKKTRKCAYEFVMSEKNIIPDNDKEQGVPYKICSFDIEASSSHGDFPVPQKTYKKLATNIMDHYLENPDLKKADHTDQATVLQQIILAAFGFGEFENVDLVYPKKKYKPTSSDVVIKMFMNWITRPIIEQKSKNVDDILTINNLFDQANMMHDEEYSNTDSGRKKTTIKKKDKIIDILSNPKFSRDELVIQVDKTLTMNFPPLEGDKVTMIGSTFLLNGEKEPYLNNAIVLNTCDDVPSLKNSEVISCKTEKEVLLRWTKLIQEEDPDIVIGYNIFGFDYEFMFRRAQENKCERDFLMLSRNDNEIAGKEVDGEYSIEESSLVIASGQHDLKFIKMNGRLQIDLYNYFRREQNLTSYKLDSVAGEFIGDKVKRCQRDETNNKTIIQSGNLTGLKNQSYICFEEIGHSTEKYRDGQKFIVDDVDEEAGTFTVEEEIEPPKGKPFRWCMAKDDVTPQDLFRLANGTSADRAIIAKYCFQDCNLVHHLMMKMDIITGFVEMAKICSVPMSFIVMRGQGIKLLSFVAKKCRDKNTLLPDIEKNGNDGGYEGAIVLPPKCNLYLDEPVACVDYSSLYPSSMISEGLSHDSKVWTREYNLDGELIKETGEKNEKGEFIYDNLPDYKYVDVTYDTYKYTRKRRHRQRLRCSTAKKLAVLRSFRMEANRLCLRFWKNCLLLVKRPERRLKQQMMSL